MTGRYCTRGHFTRVALDKYHLVEDYGFDWNSVIHGCDMVMTLDLGRGVALWNDEPGRTKDEVVEALTKVAAEVRSRYPA